MMIISLEPSDINPVFFCKREYKFYFCIERMSISFYTNFIIFIRIIIFRMGVENFEQNEEERKDAVFAKTGIACDRIRHQVKECIKESDCIQIRRLKARQCVDEQDLPMKCLQFMETLMECRRHMIDPRARFRGRAGDT